MRHLGIRNSLGVLLALTASALSAQAHAFGPARKSTRVVGSLPTPQPPPIAQVSKEWEQIAEDLDRRLPSDLQHLSRGDCGVWGVGFPIDPTTGKNWCPASPSTSVNLETNVTVFFAPHPDDETLGLGGAIAEAAQRGDLVFIELMTLGTASGAGHQLGLSAEKLGFARLREFLDSAQALGASGIRYNGFQDSRLRADQVAERVAFWRSLKIKNLKLVGVAGAQDNDTHPDHVAVYTALKAATDLNPRFQSVYYFRAQPSGARFDHWFTIKPLSASACQAKRAGLAAFAKWDPSHGRYAVGWKHSTGDLFDGANERCEEYRMKTNVKDPDTASQSDNGFYQPN